jgi:hypothetical protein
MRDPEYRKALDESTYDGIYLTLLFTTTYPLVGGKIL